MSSHLIPYDSLDPEQQQDSSDTLQEKTTRDDSSSLESYSINCVLARRFWNVFGGFVCPSKWHWLGVVGLLLTAMFHSWVSAELGNLSGEFYTAVSSKSPLKIYFVIGWTTLAYIGTSFEQALTKTITGALAVHVRRVVTDGIYSTYFKDMSYYKISLDEKIKNPDQQIAQDIDRYSSSYSTVLTEIISSPIFIAYFWYEVTVLLNWWVPFAILGYYLFSFVIQQLVMSPISRHTYNQEKLEGEFRFHHQQINSFSESIAMSRGEITEIHIGKSIFEKVLHNKMQIVYWEFLLWFISYIFSYGASVLGSILVALPILIGQPGLDYASVTTALYDIGMLAWGFTKVTTVTTSMAEFFGYAHRIGELAELTMLNASLVRTPIPVPTLPDASPPPSQFISCDGVNIYEPKSGRLLLRDVSFVVDRNTLIMGPTGSGKTSLIRVLSNLWRSRGGSVRIPDNTFFMPQKVHLPTCNIFQQITYPTLFTEVSEKLNKEKVELLLREVGLEVLLLREDLYSITDWSFLSPGQRQCLVMTRIMFHLPPVVVLDEVTSQVDTHSETIIYDLCKKHEILLLSIGHRPSLLKFHEQIFRVDIGSRQLKEEHGEAET